MWVRLWTAKRTKCSSVCFLFGMCQIQPNTRMDLLTFVRSYRFAGIALFDVVASYLAGFLVHRFLLPHSLCLVMALVLPLAVIAHLIVGQETAFNDLLFSSTFGWAQALFVTNVCVLLYAAANKFGNARASGW